MNCNIGRVRLTLIGLKEREIEKSEEMELIKKVRVKREKDVRFCNYETNISKII